LRVAGFFSCGRHGVESNEREEHNGRAAHQPSKTMRHKRVPMGRVHHECAEGNDEHNHGDLDDDYCCVRVRAFSNPVDQNDSNGRNDEHGRQIDCDGVTGNHRQTSRRISFQRRASLGEQIRSSLMIVHQPQRKLQVEQAIAELDKITRPAHGYGHVTNRVFQNQIPTDNPRYHLAHRGIGIGVG
jgi:hypothetical protein